MTEEGFVSAGPAADIPEGDMTVVEVGGIEVLVAHVAGAFYAVENECTHRGCMLSDGDIEGYEALCPCHGATFDLRTGAVLGGPAPEPLRIYKSRVVDGIVEVGGA
jgi:3-phenylpropionate/trans-cinnamate dioxygenase ferredoxin subunit